MVSGEPASARAAMSLGPRTGSSFTTERALVFSKSAKPPSRERPRNWTLSQCMSAGPARPAQAAGHVGVADHGLPDRYVRHGGAHLLDPASVLVTRDVGQEGAVRVSDQSPHKEARPIR